MKKGKATEGLTWRRLSRGIFGNGVVSEDGVDEVSAGLVLGGWVGLVEEAVERGCQLSVWHRFGADGGFALYRHCQLTRGSQFVAACRLALAA